MIKRMNNIFSIFSIIALVFLAGCGVLQIENTSSGYAEKKTTPTQPETTKETKEAAPVVISKNIGVLTDSVVDVFRKADTQSERVTQALYNQSVEILEKQESWVQVKVVDGYTGWIKSKYINFDSSSINQNAAKFKLVIKDKVFKVTSQANSGITLKNLAMGTELYAVNKVKDAYEVLLPDGKTGWVSESGVIQLDFSKSIPKTTATDFITTLDKYKGTTYLWGGVSSWGIDCSGLTYICAKINGVDLPRDADMQSEVGTKIDSRVEPIKDGDLVFFSADTDLKGISHVGIYVGNNQFIHSSSSKGMVTLGSLTDVYFKQRLVAVRRYF